MTKILQINVGVGRAAQDLALVSVVKWGADILVISEQNHNRPEDEGWFSDAAGRSAVVAISRIPINKVGPLDLGFRWVGFPGFRIYSCYCSPNCSIAEFRDFLFRLETSIRSSSTLTNAAGDFNTKSKKWGSPIENRRD